MEDVACNDDSADPLAVAVLYRASAGTDCSSNAGLTTIRRRRSGSSVLEAADPLRGDRVVSRPRRFRQEIQPKRDHNRFSAIRGSHTMRAVLDGECCYGS